MKQRWSRADRQKFADKDFLKARRRPGKRSTGPKADEWYEEAKER